MVAVSGVAYFNLSFISHKNITTFKLLRSTVLRENSSLGKNWAYIFQQELLTLEKWCSRLVLTKNFQKYTNHHLF